MRGGQVGLMCGARGDGDPESAWANCPSACYMPAACRGYDLVGEGHSDAGTGLPLGDGFSGHVPQDLEGID